MTKQRTLSVLTGALLGVLPAVAGAQPITQPGAQALGFSNWGYFPCTSTACQPTGGPMSSTQNGGAGFTSALTSFIGSAPGASEPAFLNYLASAQLQGELGMAQLKALAQSVEMTGSPPGYAGLCCYYYDANAVASALQWYTFTGLQPETFTISYTIDAIMRGTVDPQTSVDSRYLASASGGLAIWDGVTTPELALELPLGSNLDLSQVFLNGGDASATGLITGSGSVTFTVNPGGGFFMSSFLRAAVPQLAYGGVLSDASHTMNTSFTGGNTALLQAQLAGVPITSGPTTTVPEPGTSALLTAGLAALALAAVRRRGQRRAYD